MAESTSNDFAYACECPNSRCRATAPMRPSDYAKLRAAGLNVIATSGHEVPTRIIVKRGPGWVAVGRGRRNVGPARTLQRKSQSELEVRHCATCGADTLPSEHGSCLWCGTKLELAAAA